MKHNLLAIMLLIVISLSTTLPITSTHAPSTDRSGKATKTMSLNQTGEQTGGSYTSWLRTIGGPNNDWGNDIALDSSGFAYVSGLTEGYGAKDYVCLVSKLDLNGNLVWFKTIEGVNFGPRSIVSDLSEYIYISGSTSSYSWPYGHVFVCKLDSDGNLLWFKTIGGPDADLGFKIVLDSSGCIYVSGASYSYGAGSPDAFVCKLDSDGNLLWFKTIGGPDNDGAYDIALDSSGFAYVSGVKNIYAARAGDAFVCKLDLDGNPVWFKTIGGPDDDEPGDVLLDSGCIYLSGWTKSYGAGDFDAFVCKLDLGHLSSEDPPDLEWVSGEDWHPVEVSTFYPETRSYAPSVNSASPEVSSHHPSVSSHSPSSSQFVPETHVASIGRSVTTQAPMPEDYMPVASVDQLERDQLQGYPKVYYLGPIPDNKDNPSKWIIEYWFYFPYDFDRPTDWEPVYVVIDRDGNVVDVASTVHFVWSAWTEWINALTSTGLCKRTFVNGRRPVINFLMGYHTPLLDCPGSYLKVQYELLPLNTEEARRNGLSEVYLQDIEAPFQRKDHSEKVPSDIKDGLFQFLLESLAWISGLEAEMGPYLRTDEEKSLWPQCEKPFLGSSKCTVAPGDYLVYVSDWLKVFKGGVAVLELPKASSSSESFVHKFYRTDARLESIETPGFATQWYQFDMNADIRGQGMDIFDFLVSEFGTKWNGGPIRLEEVLSIKIGEDQKHYYYLLEIPEHPLAKTECVVVKTYIDTEDIITVGYLDFRGARETISHVTTVANILGQLKAGWDPVVTLAKPLFKYAFSYGQNKIEVKITQSANEIKSKNLFEFIASTLQRALCVSAGSDVKLAVMDAEGRRVGGALEGGQWRTYDEIPNASYSGLESHPQYIVIPEPKVGSYTFIVAGREGGEFRLNVTSIVNGSTSSSQTCLGTVGQGETQEYLSELLSDGKVAIRPAHTTDRSLWDRYGLFLLGVGLAIAVATALYLRQRQRRHRISIGRRPFPEPHQEVQYTEERSEESKPVLAQEVETKQAVTPPKIVVHEETSLEVPEKGVNVSWVTLSTGETLTAKTEVRSGKTPNVYLLDEQTYRRILLRGEQITVGLLEKACKATAKHGQLAYQAPKYARFAFVFVNPHPSNIEVSLKYEVTSGTLKT